MIDIVNFGECFTNKELIELHNSIKIRNHFRLNLEENNPLIYYHRNGYFYEIVIHKNIHSNFIDYHGTPLSQIDFNINYGINLDSVYTLISSTLDNLVARIEDELYLRTSTLSDMYK